MSFCSPPTKLGDVANLSSLIHKLNGRAPVNYYKNSQGVRKGEEEDACGMKWPAMPVKSS